MGLDWTKLSLSAYLEALEAYNAAHNPDQKEKPEASDRLKRFLKAHTEG